MLKKTPVTLTPDQDGALRWPRLVDKENVV